MREWPTNNSFSHHIPRNHPRAQRGFLDEDTSQGTKLTLQVEKQAIKQIESGKEFLNRWYRRIETSD